MANPEIKNNDLGSVDLFGTVYGSSVYVVSAAAVAAGELVEGLILARNTATGKLEDYVSGGANGTGIPVAVVGRDIDLTGKVATDEIEIDVIISGHVRTQRLSIAAGDTVDNIITDALRDYSIVAESVVDVSKLDNQ